MAYSDFESEQFEDQLQLRQKKHAGGRLNVPARRWQQASCYRPNFAEEREA